jgi:hypothetical protein
LSAAVGPPDTQGAFERARAVPGVATSSPSVLAARAARYATYFFTASFSEKRGGRADIPATG